MYWQRAQIPIALHSFAPAAELDLCLAHDPAFVQGVLRGELPNGFGNMSLDVAGSLPYMSGAMIAAARAALETGCACAPVSGFHHAQYGSAGGYCTFNGLLVASQVLLESGAVGRVLILDCDMHYGDGTDEILIRLGLGGSITNATFGRWFHQPDQAHAYLQRLRQAVSGFDSFDLVIFQAGADVHVDDPLGGVLSTEQMIERDRIVFDAARASETPIAWSLAGWLPGAPRQGRRLAREHDERVRQVIRLFRWVGMTSSVTEALACLKNHADYRILTRLEPAAGGSTLVTGTIRRGAIVDTETTGVALKTDQVLEIGIVVFDYAVETGQVGPVVGALSALEDPGRPIPAESTAIHGIIDDMVRGQRFDDAAVARLLDGVDLVVAHNASFDRPLLEARFPFFRELSWGCSIRDIPWHEAGHASSALEFLAYRAGFFYEGHRAEIDCRALLAILARPLGATGARAMKALHDCARRPAFRLYALDSPFSAKDSLKARGYRWNAERRVWMLPLAEADLGSERSWLKGNVYGGRSVELELEMLDARVRYSGREGMRQRVRI
jgi:DNA polymerase III subunit epsilon